jgi:hypothetical protein
MEMNDNEIMDWLDSMKIYHYDICDGVVHVVGNVNLNSGGLFTIPVQFGYVSGHFRCRSNYLESLEGFPNEVGGDFDCSYNRLYSLEDGPSEVGGSFYCTANRLESLVGCPSEVGGEFGCSSNKLGSLTAGPSVVGGNFICKVNLFIVEPEHSHIKIGGDFRWE